MLHHPDPRVRERLLVFGGAGMGKSTDWLTIARYAQQTGSDALFYVVDTDNAIEHMLVTEFAELTNIRGGEVEGIPATVFGWKPAMDAVDKALANMRRQDWLVVDLADSLWPWVQAYFTEQVFDESLDDYFLQARKMDKTQGGGFEGWTDWPVINKMWAGFSNKLLQCPGNVFCTATQKALNPTQEGKDIVDIFGSFGVKPAGQKTFPHSFHTCLWKSRSAKGEWRITTCKDRGRTYLQGATEKDFFLTWMVPVAGWRP